MLDMNVYVVKEEVRDNEVSINGISFGKLSDRETEQIISIIRSMQAGNFVDLTTKKQPVKQVEKKVCDYSKIAPPTDVTVGIKWLDDNHFITDGYFGKATSMAFHKMLDGMISYDSDYIRDDVYKRDYGAHKVGEHKKGAWKLEKASDVFNQDTKQFVITADAIQGARSDIADRIAKREARLG